MSSSKPRIVKDYEKLDVQTQEQIKLAYPRGFDRFLIKFQNKEGRTVSALPFETEEKYYLVRMTTSEAIAIIEEDDDYNDDGLLKKKVKEKYTSKYEDDDEDDEDEDDLLDDIEDDSIDFDQISEEDLESFD